MWFIDSPARALIFKGNDNRAAHAGAGEVV